MSIFAYLQLALCLFTVYYGISDSNQLMNCTILYFASLIIVKTRAQEPPQTKLNLDCLRTVRSDNDENMTVVLECPWYRRLWWSGWTIMKQLCLCQDGKLIELRTHHGACNKSCILCLPSPPHPKHEDTYVRTKIHATEVSWYIQYYPLMFSVLSTLKALTYLTHHILLWLNILNDNKSIFFQMISLAAASI